MGSRKSASRNTVLGLLATAALILRWPVEVVLRSVARYLIPDLDRLANYLAVYGLLSGGRRALGDIPVRVDRLDG